jgi:hypothetical protein
MTSASLLPNTGSMTICCIILLLGLAPLALGLYACRIRFSIHSRWRECCRELLHENAVDQLEQAVLAVVQLKHVHFCGRTRRRLGANAIERNRPETARPGEWRSRRRWVQRRRSYGDFAMAARRREEHSAIVPRRRRPASASQETRSGRLFASRFLPLRVFSLVAPLEVGRHAGVHRADHVEVVVVDVDHFLGVLIDQRVRHRPADADDLGVVDRALVVGVVQLHRAQ